MDYVVKNRVTGASCGIFPTKGQAGKWVETYTNEQNAGLSPDDPRYCSPFDFFMFVINITWIKNGDIHIGTYPMGKGIVITYCYFSYQSGSRTLWTCKRGEKDTRKSPFDLCKEDFDETIAEGLSLEDMAIKVCEVDLKNIVTTQE